MRYCSHDPKEAGEVNGQVTDTLPIIHPLGLCT
jgi:hypothetical protein